MQKCFPITYNGEPTGTMNVTREGLYYRFQGQCTFSKNVYYRIIAEYLGGTKDLGLCVPTGNSFMLQKKIAIKQIPQDNWSFYATDGNSTPHFIGVKDDQPFIYLSSLEYALLSAENGGYGLRITDQSLGQPDNDPSP